MTKIELIPGRRIGCVARQPSGEKQELQLWIHQNEMGSLFNFEIKRRVETTARFVGASSVETGKPQASYKVALEQGLEAMTRLLKS